MLQQIQMQKKQIPLSRIQPGPYQPRRTFDRDAMLGLAEAIQAQGLINPPIVASTNNGHYDLVAGERRWRAMCAIALAEQVDGLNLSEVVEQVSRANAPAWLKQDLLTDALNNAVVAVNLAPPEADPWALAVIDNLQRQDLSPTEEGHAYAALQKQGYTLTRIARECGVSHPTVKSRLALVSGDLDPEIGAMVNRGEIPRSERAINALLSLPAGQRLKMARLYGKNPQATLNVLEAACCKVGEAQQTIPVAPQSTVPVKAANVSAQSPVSSTSEIVPARPPVGSLDPEASDIIRQLSEEMCGPCSVGKGLTAACLTCEGFLEFARTLLIRVNE